MQILGQSTKVPVNSPYVHLGYLAATNTALGGGFPVVGALLVAIGLLFVLFKKKSLLILSIVSIVTGILLILLWYLSSEIKTKFAQPAIEVSASYQQSTQ